MEKSSEFWTITFEERTKHDASFMQLGPTNGYLTGDKAREFFLRSNLAISVLGQVWNLADINKDGKLDKKEFSIACSLIKKCLTNGPTVLPATLPNSMLIEPTSPVISKSTVNTPLFNAQFPVAATPVTSITSPITTPAIFPGISLTGLNSINNSTPATNSAVSNRMQPFTTSGTNLMSTMSNGMSMSLSSLTPSVVPTPFTAANNNLPNPIAPIPSTSRIKYSQMFQSNDPNSTGYITGMQAKTLLMQTSLTQAVLAQIWTLADYDKDGKLSLEEFIIAMHLCDYSKNGNQLPQTLPIELQPQRSKTANLPMLNSSNNLNSLDIFSSPPINITQTSSVTMNSQEQLTLTAKQQSQHQQHTFEDKRRENFDRGNAILEAKRQMLREAEEREKREREEKERVELEKKQKIKEEQEKRRQLEIEKQMERQRLLDSQREEERKKILEQREAARNELIRQQRIEWEKQKNKN